MKRLTYIILFMLYAAQMLHAQAVNDTIPEKFDFELLGKSNGIIQENDNGQFVYVNGDLLYPGTKKL